MNPSTAGNDANYQVVSTRQCVKKKTEPVLKLVGFTAAYQQANDVNSVILTIKHASPVCEGRSNQIIMRFRTEFRAKAGLPSRRLTLS